MDGTELASLGSGWLTLGLVFTAGLVPLGFRLRHRRRAAPNSGPISLHVALGLAVVAAAFVHSVLGVLSLGSERAIGASELSIWAGVIAVLVLMAHVGVGLQLRNPKLRERTRLRRWHLTTALTIAVCAVVHALLLWIVEV
jgi:hypothetical protein